jgi:hypothetical protein
MNFRSLLFEEVNENRVPIPDVAVVPVETVPVQTVAEITISSKKDLNFIAHFFGRQHDQPNLRASDNEHDYSRCNSEMPEVQTADKNLQVNTLTTIIAEPKIHQLCHKR